MYINEIALKGLLIDKTIRAEKEINEILYVLNTSKNQPNENENNYSNVIIRIELTPEEIANIRVEINKL